MIIEEQVKVLLSSGKSARVFKVNSSDGDTTKPDFEKLTGLLLSPFSRVFRLTLSS